MCGPKVGVLFGCESELVGLVDLLFSVESSSLQVVGKGVSVVSSLTTPVIALGLCLCRFLLLFFPLDGKIAAYLLSRALTMADIDSAFVIKCWKDTKRLLR
jgi:hypothetical protein